MATLDGVDLGKIQNFDEQKEGDIEVQSMPGSDSGDTIAYDLMGVVRSISLKGVKGGTFVELKAFADTMRNLLDGAQSGSTLVTDMTGSINVYIKTWSFKWSIEPTQYSINYSMTLVEGS